MPERQSRKRKPKSSSTKTKAKRSTQPSDPVLLDPELCRSSESEPEDYGDLNGKERWEIDGVVDSHCGENDRMSYKLRWDKTAWQRRDGTSEEWIPAPKDSHSEHNTFIRDYEARELAKHDPDDLPPADFDVLRSFLALPPGSSKNLWLQSDLLPTLALHQMQAKLAGNSQVISKFQVEDQDFAQIELPVDEQEHEDEAPAPPTVFPSQTKRERVESPSLGGTPAHNSRVIPTPLTALKKLENAWNEAAARAGAVSITLENEFDSSIPQLKHKFVYSEMDLHWSPDVDQFPPDPDAFESCHCRSECRPHVCGCQAPIFDTNTPAPRALHSFAYNKHGYFNLNFQGVSIECNEVSLWSALLWDNHPIASHSIVDVAQHVRIVSFNVHEEFILRYLKLKSEGGEFAPARVLKKVKCLARLLARSYPNSTRENASSLKRDIAAFDMATGRKIKFRDRNRYLFDLDASESTYTLDCWRVGNWTRFINHKCEPNLKIFPVCYDTLPGRGLERLAVVALHDIPAGEELTIDYDPGHHQDSSSQTSYHTLLLPMDTQPSTHFSPPPPLYSEDIQSIHPGVEPALTDDQPLILITPPEGKLTFQSGFLGAEGDISSLEGEVHIKSASTEKWNHVSIVYRSEEHVGLNKVELGFSKHTLYSQAQAPSSSTNPDAGALPGVLPFSIPLTPDTPQCLHTSTSAISHSLTVTLESSTLPAVSKSVEIHTRRYTTITSPYLPVAPRSITLDTPTPVTVEVPRTVFRSGEPIPLYWDIPPPDGSAMRRGLRLRNLRAELVRLIRVDNGDDDDDGESITSEDETGWAPGELNMSAFTSPLPTAGFEKGSSMQADQQSAAGSLPSGGPMHPTIVTRSGTPARLHPTRPVRIRLVLHGLSHDPQADIQRQENTHEVCASISQTTLMHDVSFHVILRASFLVDGQEKTFKGRIPVTILPRVAPQVEAPVELEDAYMKKHDKPPTKTVRAADADHGEGPSTGPPPAFDEGGAVNDPSAPPPFADAAYTAPPPEPSGSRLPTFQESESRAAESGTPGGHLPTFFESEAAAAASSASTSQALPPAPSGTFGEWTQNSANRMELRFPGEGSSYGFSPQDQFDGLTLGLSHEQGLPTDPTLSHPHSSAMLSPDILADINSDLPPPLTPVGDDPISNLAMRLQILAAASTDVNETAPPPPPPLDDPADPPPSINDRFRQTPGSAVPLTEAPQPVPTDSALPPYLNPGAPAPAAAGPPAYTDIPPRAAH